MTDTHTQTHIHTPSVVQPTTTVTERHANTPTTNTQPFLAMVIKTFDLVGCITCERTNLMQGSVNKQVKD